MIWTRVFRIFLGFFFFCVFFVGVLRIWLCFGSDISFYVIVRIEKKKILNVVFKGYPSTHFWIWFKDGILELWFTFEANALLKYCLKETQCFISINDHLGMSTHVLKF